METYLLEQLTRLCVKVPSMSREDLIEALRGLSKLQMEFIRTTAKSNNPNRRCPSQDISAMSLILMQRWGEHHNANET